jgi:hypothetical protein
MRGTCAWLGFPLCVAGLLIAIADAAQPEGLIFLSTQLRPIEEAQKMRNAILKDFPQEVDYTTELPQQFLLRIKADQQGATHAIDVVGALHGELVPLVPLDALAPLDDLAGRLTGRGIPDPFLTLGKLGTAHQLYIPWTQANYIMVANKAALPYLPAGADINTLSYDELAAWAGTIQQKTGKPLLGFPAGPIALRRHQPSLRLRCCRTTPTATSPRNTTRSDLIGRFWGDTAFERRVVPEDQHENSGEEGEERDGQQPGGEPASGIL